MGLTEKQKEYWRGATHRWNIKCGAVRSGKTWMDYAFVLPHRLRRMEGEGLFVLMGYTQETVNRNILSPMRRLWGEENVGFVRGDNTVRLFGKVAHVLGADTRERVRAIQGSSFLYCYGDEVATWSEEVFEMVKSRLDLPGSMFEGTCNPEGPAHWFKRFLDSGADIFRQEYTIDDNPHLPEDFVRQLKAEYAGSVQYDRYILGRWVKAEGLVYRSFDARRHVCRDTPGMRRVSFAADVGHSNATAFLALGEGEDGRLYVLDEYYHSGRESGEVKSPMAYAREFAAFLSRVMAAHDGARYGGVYVDPSALGFMAQLRELGMMKVYRARNDVLAGVQRVASLMDADGLRVAARCGNFLREVSGYVWDDRAAAQGEDRPVKTDDHCMDALRYYVASRRR